MTENSAADGRTFDAISPIDGRVLAKVMVGDKEDVTAGETELST